jgi:hypothetical protein
MMVDAKYYQLSWKYLIVDDDATVRVFFSKMVQKRALLCYRKQRRSCAG